MEIIKIKNLEKVYNPKTIPVYALNGIDLSIHQGEFTAIVGPSGSGKTTLLNAIGGLDRPTKGSILIDGKDITQRSPSKLIDFRLMNIGFVFQDYSLLPVLSARENVELIMQLQKTPSSEYKIRAKQLLEDVGLGDKMNNKPSELSGGQQQRVAVARALASKPKFVLADEPTANLDSKSTEELLNLMLKLNKEEDTTFIFSTHDQRVIDKARRVITVDDGKVTSDVVRGESTSSTI